jgi:hypothetical protein
MATMEAGSIIDTIGTMRMDRIVTGTSAADTPRMAMKEHTRAIGQGNILQ